MYRLHIAIADLEPPASGEVDGLPRLPTLERLCARADVRAGPRDWRLWALSRLGCPVGTETPALARFLAEQQGLEVHARTWFVLTPLHLVAGLSTVHHHAAGPVLLDPAEARALAVALTADFGDEQVAFYAVGALVLMGIVGALLVSTQDPAPLAGRDLADAAARGPDAQRLVRLGGEFELWLHGRRLTGRDGRVVHALHPWGHGPGLVTPATVSPRLLTTDPFLVAAQGASLAANAALDVWSMADLLAQGHSFHEADAIWAQPLRARLRDGEISSVELHVAGRTFAITARQRWRFYRTVRPWWEQFS